MLELRTRSFISTYALALLLAALATILTAAAVKADSFWDHNGSLMRLEANGAQRVLTYEEPQPILQRAGATRGTVLFDGRNVGNYYVGRARRFSRDCDAPLVYDVEGPVTNNGLRIVVRGEREVYAEGCRPTGRMVEDVLVFTYEWSD